MKEMQRVLKQLEVAEFVIQFCICLAVIAAVAFCHGCTATPDGIYIDETIWIYATNRLDQTVQKHSGSATDGSVNGGGASSGAVAGPDSSSTTQTPTEDKPAETATEFKADWRYGGFDGSNAKEDSRCRISSPTITTKKVSWRWDTGIPSDWKRGATSKGPMVIFAVFYWDEAEKKWIGGKMDWCDENRTSRDMENIYDGYNGWKSAGWEAAKKRAFCVVSADGKFRSNVPED